MSQDKSELKQKSEKGKPRSSGKRLIKRNTIIVLMAIVTVIVLLLIFSKSFRETVEEAVLPDESKLSQTYNASRYFFRFGYPDDWTVENDVSGFGFLSDSEKGIVVKAYPSSEIGKTPKPEVTMSPVPSGTEKPSNSKPSIIEDEKLSTVMNIFYRPIKQGESVSSDAACRRFIEEFSEGLMYNDEGYVAEYKFGDISKYVADNLTFYRVEYICSVYVAGEDGIKQGESPVETLSGDIYAASRSMAYYAINFETDLQTNSSLYSKYHKDFINIVNDFRFSVFKD